MWILFPEDHLLKRLFFSHWMVLASLSIIIWPYKGGFISGLSIPMACISAFMLVPYLKLFNSISRLMLVFIKEECWILFNACPEFIEIIMSFCFIHSVHVVPYIDTFFIQWISLPIQKSIPLGHSVQSFQYDAEFDLLIDDFYISVYKGYWSVVSLIYFLVVSFSGFCIQLNICKFCWFLHKIGIHFSCFLYCFSFTPRNILFNVHTLYSS